MRNRYIEIFIKLTREIVYKEIKNLNNENVLLFDWLNNRYIDI